MSGRSFLTLRLMRLFLWLLFAILIGVWLRRLEGAVSPHHADALCLGYWDRLRVAYSKGKLSAPPCQLLRACLTLGFGVQGSAATLQGMKQMNNCQCRPNSPFLVPFPVRLFSPPLCSPQERNTVSAACWQIKHLHERHLIESYIASHGSPRPFAVYRAIQQRIQKSVEHIPQPRLATVR